MFPTDDTTFMNYMNMTVVVKATAGDSWISVQPSVPTALYGKIVQLVGVDFCYVATTNTYLTHVDIDTITATTGPGDITYHYIDDTHRTDSACRYYALPAPINLTPFDDVVFYILIHWNAGGTNFFLGRTTFVLQPTDIEAPLIPLTDSLVPLSKTDTTGEVPTTITP
jgi:hypothetical protein